MKIFFDENFPPNIADALKSLEDGSKYRTDHIRADVHHIKIEFGAGTKDEEWIPKVAQRGGVVITQDHALRANSAQRHLWKAHKLGIVIVRVPKGSAYWDIVMILVSKWAEIKECVAAAKSPFFIEVTPRRKPKLLPL